MNLRERFEAKIEPCPMTGCWLWSANLTRWGYGTISVNGQKKPAHRVAWLLYKHSIPDGLWVLHSCDVPSCVNPAHLFIGTHADNMRDMNRKGSLPLPAEFFSVRGRRREGSGCPVPVSAMVGAVTILSFTFSASCAIL